MFNPVDPKFIFTVLLWITLGSASDAVHALPNFRYQIISYSHFLHPRNVIAEPNADGSITILNPITQSAITQGSASDGSGSGFDISAILWIAFSLVIGSFLSFIGFRGWRITTGIGLGLALAISSWAAIVNSETFQGIPDIVLTLIVYAFFSVGVVLGAVLELGRIAGSGILGITGGLSLGIRIVLLRSDLLVHIFYINWMIIAVFGVTGLVLLLFRQRIGILLGCSFSGTFLFALGVDIIIHKQSGMSRGLRMLFDQNSAHLADILTNGYNPTLSTQIMIGVSIALAPIVAYGQHRIFRQQFNPADRPNSTSDFSMLYPDIPVDQDSSKLAVLPSRFSV